VVWCNAETLAREVRKLELEAHVSRFAILLHWDRPRFDVAQWWRQVREGRALVRRHGIRLLHSNSAAPCQWLLPVARAERLPLLVHLHAPYQLRERMTLGLHQATLVVGVTRGCIEGLLADGMPAARTKTIYNGVDPATFAVGDERGLRARLGIPADAVVLARVGSLIHRKAVDVMLRVFARLRAERRGVQLLIAGEGPDRAALEAQARALGVADAAHFLGYVPSTGALLRDATDIAVSPARMEGFGLTVIEAGLAGKPVVATDTTGMTEILRSGENGTIVPVEDEDALLAALRELVDSPSLRARYAEALRRTVEERFLVSTYVRSFEETYAELLARPRESLGWSAPWTPPGMYLRWLRGVVGRRLGVSPSADAP
jgi:glycosyltransferase involved in cell wall biosynthesis